MSNVEAVGGIFVHQLFSYARSMPEPANRALMEANGPQLMVFGLIP